LSQRLACQVIDLTLGGFHAEVFENKTENKLIYTDIFRQYTALIGASPLRNALQSFL
jgi:hypothetical protein